MMRRDSARTDKPVTSWVLSPEDWTALRYAMARLAVDLVSGPAGFLPPGCGVILGDMRCAWPRCGRSAAYCDVHHIVHKEDGGRTAVDGCVLLCRFHHDICVHRWGWRIILHPDGTTSAHDPHGQILHSHSPHPPHGLTRGDLEVRPRAQRRKEVP